MAREQRRFCEEMLMRALAACLALALLAGCSTTPGQDRLAERDPLEGFNRGVWGFNRGIDNVLLKPAGTVYRAVTPKPARRGLSAVLTNLGEPFSAINNLLQGKPKRAFHNLGRFVVNSTIGVGGLADHASEFGIKPAPEDFGQTLAVWGANGGPYLVLPIFGPSTLRDGIGTGVAQFADPYRVCMAKCGIATRTQRWGATAGEAVILRSDATEGGADTFLASSLDPYATARSAYLQRRRAQILDQEEEGGTGEQDVTLEPAVESGTPAPIVNPGTAPSNSPPATPAPDAPPQ
jgi:phospholipid-binding lipoprotein MlaA